MKRKVVKVASVLTSATLAFSCFTNALFRWSFKYKLEQNSFEYSEELEQYNNFLVNYAEYINSLNLNDLEIFIKVIKDQWSDIEGYGKCDNLINGYFRLCFQEEGKGVCTSFADDFTARLNAINPKYNAKNMVVHMETIGVESENVDIKRNIIENSTNNANGGLFSQIYGNHMVSVVELPETNIKLVIDPTNLLIGVLKNGQIDILNIEKPGIMEWKFYSSSHYTTDSYISLFKEYLSTYETPFIDNQMIECEYGYDAQKTALEKINDLDEKVIRKIKLNG